MSAGGQGKRWMRFTAKAGRKRKSRGGWESKGERHACGDVDVKEDLILWRGSLWQRSSTKVHLIGRIAVSWLIPRRWPSLHVHWRPQVHDDMKIKYFYSWTWF